MPSITAIVKIITTLAEIAQPQISKIIGDKKEISELKEEIENLKKENNCLKKQVRYLIVFATLFVVFSAVTAAIILF